MLKLSEIISKPVLNIYSGKVEGIIYGTIFDKNLKRITKFKLFDEEEEEYLLDTNKIYSIGQNMCVIKNNEPLSLYFQQNTLDENNPINKQVYTTTGDKIGKITDLEISEKFEVKTLICNNQTINPNKILNISESIIINLENKKIKLNSLKPKIKLEKNKNVVTILPKIESPENNLKSEKKEVFKIDASPIPLKISSNVNFLIGRKVSKTIYGINNEIIIKKDMLITEKCLENAKRHSKLGELTLFSKLKA